MLDAVARGNAGTDKELSSVGTQPLGPPPPLKIAVWEVTRHSWRLWLLPRRFSGDRKCMEFLGRFKFRSKVEERENLWLLAFSVQTLGDSAMF